ncbi:hypothetical protein BC628DRAFT_1355683 [Trametes gibbosa]|nr:hypothetical protein BC628DRAFT_1355683 [Trametes gibbosa]
MANSPPPVPLQFEAYLLPFSIVYSPHPNTAPAERAHLSARARASALHTSEALSDHGCPTQYCCSSRGHTSPTSLYPAPPLALSRPERATSRRSWDDDGKLRPRRPLLACHQEYDVFSGTIVFALRFLSLLLAVGRLYNLIGATARSACYRRTRS